MFEPMLPTRSCLTAINSVQTIKIRLIELITASPNYTTHTNSGGHAQNNPFKKNRFR